MKKYTTLLLLFAVIIFGCEKDEPVIADFSYVPDWYLKGAYNFTNNSINATSVEWDDGMGNRIYNQNPTIVFPKNGTYYVTLNAKGKSGQNSKTQSITVTNLPTTGNYLIFTRLPSDGYITVYINGINAGDISKYQISSNTPDCGTAGFVNLTREQGTYTLTARSQTGKTWNTSITFEAGTCKRLQLN
ncbi:MAG: PKD domain-containing protein [Flectobacillus sp.]|uniref:PKD domain-containing protein n=1 Tax=Flectobacillus sp. TaxID=50419 RepID=UPI003B997C46